MRRKDREITDFKKLVEMIDHCEVIRLGLFDDVDKDFPYIVPVNFSYEADETTGEINFYIHGAMAGRKYELLKKTKKCSFEMDNLLKIDYLYDCHDITSRYECVMGTGVVEEIPDSEKEKIMEEKVLSRWEEARTFQWNRNALPRCGMFKIVVKTISGKLNPLGSSGD
ncbi:MAG: pyridoxamine 5'-phosphate oxidase family protein [Treponema sp.]|nr:pyridoxamine 5'-phosphate oxidase family protein [Treponema sp.]